MLTRNEIEKQLNLGNIKIENLKAGALEKPNSCLVSIEDYLYTLDNQVVDTKNRYEYMNEISTSVVDRYKKLLIPKEGIILEPNKLYVARTSERITTKGYIPVLNGRNSLSSLGISIELNNGYWDENYDDNILITIICAKRTKIYPGLVIGNLSFFKSLEEKSSTIGMLSGKEIEKQLELGNIKISPTTHTLINPNSINLSLNNTLAYYPEDIIDINKKNRMEKITFDENGIVLYPNQIYVGRSNEWIETDKYVPMLSGRSSLGRLGCHSFCSGGMGSLGYKGYFHTPMRPMAPIKMYPNMKHAQLYFYTPTGKIDTLYNGSMQNLNGADLESKYYKKVLKR